ncbi:MAG: PaaI family thioesterase [Deltaproteobacteria bacterium]
MDLSLLAPNRDRFSELPEERKKWWAKFPNFKMAVFPSHLGMELEELREDYARLKLPYREEFNQPAGVVHGGVIASLIDTVVVPAIGSAYEDRPDLLTIDMQIQYMGAVIQKDMYAEGWVTKRGRSVVFARAEVRDADGRMAATGTLAYTIRRKAKS